METEKEKSQPPSLGWKEKCSGVQILAPLWHGDGQRRMLGELPGSGDSGMSIKGGRLQRGSTSLLWTPGIHVRCLI